MIWNFLHLKQFPLENFQKLKSLKYNFIYEISLEKRVRAQGNGPWNIIYSFKKQLNSTWAWALC